MENLDNASKFRLTMMMASDYANQLCEEIKSSNPDKVETYLGYWIQAQYWAEKAGTLSVGQIRSLDDIKDWRLQVETDICSMFADHYFEEIEKLKPQSAKTGYIRITWNNGHEDLIQDYSVDPGNEEKAREVLAIFELQKDSRAIGIYLYRNSEWLESSSSQEIKPFETIVKQWEHWKKMFLISPVPIARELPVAS